MAWIMWRIKPDEFDFVIWTDFQAQSNLWPMAFFRLVRLYKFKLVFIEHHPPECHGDWPLHHKMNLLADRVRLFKSRMFVFSKDLQALWSARLGGIKNVKYVPWGVWPKMQSDQLRINSRKDLGVAEHVRMLLVFGVQAVKRKHIDTLSDALRDFVPAVPLLIVFAGALNEKEIHPFSNWKNPRIDVMFENGFVTESRANQYFAAADAVWANYRNFPGASGVLLQAIGYGRLSLSSSEGEIGMLSKEHNLGPVVDSPSVADLRNAVDRFVMMPKDKQRAWEPEVSLTSERYAWPEIAKQLIAELRD